MECNFCKQFYKYYKNLYSNEEDIAWKITLTIHNKWRNGAYFVSTPEFNIGALGYKLKYCPVCGRKLEA